MKAAANRGKYAEGEVRKWLKARSLKEAGLDFHRFPDPHAGSLQAVPGDFEAIQHGHCTMIEVKEVEHAVRLAYKNFSTDKVGRMVKRQLAGATCVVLVCHMPTKVWRRAPLSFFQTRNHETPSGSWDLSEFPLVKMAATLEDLFK